MIQSGTLISGKSLYPVGERFIQYPEDDGTFDVQFSPESKFGGSWVLIFANEGIIFQTEGYDGEGRINGLMESQIQGFRLNIPVAGYDRGGASSGYHIASQGAWFGYDAYQPISATPVSGHQYITTGAHGAIKVGTRSCHRNRTFRIWERIL